VFGIGVPPHWLRVGEHTAKDADGLSDLYCKLPIPFPNLCNQSGKILKSTTSSSSIVFLLVNTDASLSATYVNQEPLVKGVANLQGIAVP